MEKVNIQKLPLSALSYTVITNDDSYGVNPSEAEAEIKRRFENTGFDYDEFLAYEEDAIYERGEDKNNYLISSNPNSQKLMETFFTQVYPVPAYSEHGRLLFSEVLLCNSRGGIEFFKEAVQWELQNLRKRMENEELTEEDQDLLRAVFEALKERSEVHRDLFQDNSISDAVMDFVLNESSLMSDKRVEHLDELAHCGKKLALYRAYLSSAVLTLDSVDHLNMMWFARRDFARLKEQRKSIMHSVRSGDEVDYSFVRDKQLILEPAKTYYEAS